MDLKNSKSNITGVLASLLAVLYPFFNYYGYSLVTLSFLGALRGLEPRGRETERTRERSPASV